MLAVLAILTDTGYVMEDTQSFNDLLFQAILERQQLFDSYHLPKMREDYSICQSSVRTLHTILVRKGIIHDDPYKYDSKTTDIQIPADDSFTESEKAIVIGQRLAQYEAMLDFLNNYWQFSCDYLTTERVSKLVAFNKTFAWDNVSNTSTRPNTKGLADLLNTIRNGSDSLSVGIINDSITQLGKSTQQITKTLKGLTEFHRERYKTAVRKLVLPGTVINTGALSHGYSEAIKEIKRSFAINMKGQPFYTELIEEILKEEYAPDHEVLQQELLARLLSNKQGAQKTLIPENFKNVLLDGIRTVGSTSPQLDEIAFKLAENYHVMTNVEKSFFQKLIDTFRKAFKLKTPDEELTIHTIDPVTQTGKKEIINFNEFIEDLKRKSRIMTGCAVKTSPSYQKIEGMEEQQILDLLTRYIAELNATIKICAGLDDYFKQNTSAEVRERIRGIKVELSAIRNNLVKANQCRAEYASQVEEQQQLKKLGITNV